MALFFSVAVLLPQLLPPIDLSRVNEINFLNVVLLVLDGFVYEFRAIVTR